MKRRGQYKKAIFVLAAAVAITGGRRARAQGEGEPALPAPAPTTGPEPVPTPAASAPEAEPPEAEPRSSPAAAPLPAEVPPYPDHISYVLLPPPPAARWRPVSGIGIALFAGGGVTDFIEGNTRNQTNTGGSWTARMAFGTRNIVGFDGSYVGGANAINSLGSGNATLIRNGLEGAIRVNAPLVARDTLLEPYAVAGVGWNSYRITNMSSVNASLSPTTDNTLSVPLGAGFTVGYHGFLADLRFTFRPTYNQNIFTAEGTNALSNWDLGAMLGYEF